MATKKCSKCEAVKPHSEFPPRKSSRDGLHGWCRPCYRAYYTGAMREWRKRNPERDQVNQRRFRENNPESALGRYARYRERNRERTREYARKRREEQPEKVRAVYDRWRQRHLAQERERGHRRRVMKQEADEETIALISVLLDSCCAYCGTTENITIDHVVPLARGGTHTVDNLLPACGSCNSSKGTKLLEEWLPEAA